MLHFTDNNNIMSMYGELFHSLINLKKAWFQSNLCIDEDFTLTNEKSREKLISRITNRCASDEYRMSMKQFDEIKSSISSLQNKISEVEKKVNEVFVKSKEL